jgi:hypothetical protein
MQQSLDQVNQHISTLSSRVSRIDEAAQQASIAAATATSTNSTLVTLSTTLGRIDEKLNNVASNTNAMQKTVADIEKSEETPKDPFQQITIDDPSVSSQADQVPVITAEPENTDTPIKHRGHKWKNRKYISKSRGQSPKDTGDVEIIPSSQSENIGPGDTLESNPSAITSSEGSTLTIEKDSIEQADTPVFTEVDPTSNPSDNSAEPVAIPTGEGTNQIVTEVEVREAGDNQSIERVEEAPSRTDSNEKVEMIVPADETNLDHVAIVESNVRDGSTIDSIVEDLDALKLRVKSLDINLPPSKAFKTKTAIKKKDPFKKKKTEGAFRQDDIEVAPGEDSARLVDSPSLVETSPQLLAGEEHPKESSGSAPSSSDETNTQTIVKLAPAPDDGDIQMIEEAPPPPSTNDTVEMLQERPTPESKDTVEKSKTVDNGSPSNDGDIQRIEEATPPPSSNDTVEMIQERPAPESKDTEEKSKTVDNGSPSNDGDIQRIEEAPPPSSNDTVEMIQERPDPDVTKSEETVPAVPAESKDAEAPDTPPVTSEETKSTETAPDATKSEETVPVDDAKPNEESVVVPVEQPSSDAQKEDEKKSEGDKVEETKSDESKISAVIPVEDQVDENLSVASAEKKFADTVKATEEKLASAKNMFEALKQRP